MAADQSGWTMDRILSGGGQKAIAILVDRGVSGAALNSAIGRRFPGISAEVRSELIAYARQISLAADALNSMGGQGNVPIDEIPINRNLYQHGGEGLRAKLGYEVTFPDSGVTKRFFIDLPDLFTMSDVWNEILAQLETFIEDSPDAFGWERKRNVPRGTDIRFFLAERLF